MASPAESNLRRSRKPRHPPLSLIRIHNTDRVYKHGPARDSGLVFSSAPCSSLFGQASRRAWLPKPHGGHGNWQAHDTLALLLVGISRGSSFWDLGGVDMVYSKESTRISGVCAFPTESSSRGLTVCLVDVTVISPNTYFNFTPLLASCAVGTLEFRTAIEPVRSNLLWNELDFSLWSLGPSICPQSGMYPFECHPFARW
jgi:hypothetical protein